MEHKLYRMIAIAPLEFFVIFFESISYLVFSENKKPENTLSGILSKYELTRLAVGLGLSIPNLFQILAPRFSSLKPGIGFPVFLLLVLICLSSQISSA